MTRPYFVNVTIDLADEEDRVPGEHTGRGFGFRIEDPLKDGQHGEFFAERLQRALAERLRHGRWSVIANSQSRFGSGGSVACSSCNYSFERVGPTTGICNSCRNARGNGVPILTKPANKA